MVWTAKRVGGLYPPVNYVRGMWDALAIRSDTSTPYARLA